MSKYKYAKVYADDATLKLLSKRAKKAGLSRSAFLRNSGLSRKIIPVFDQGVILKLLKLGADQGRLGGLFKLYLTQGDLLEVGLSGGDVLQIVRDLGEIQAEIMGLIASAGRVRDDSESDQAEGRLED